MSSVWFNPYEKDDDISNPIYHDLKQACISGDLETVQSLLWKSDLNQSESLDPEHLQRCLFEAITNSKFSVARHLIRNAGAELKPMECVVGYKVAARIKSVEAFEFLLQEGWDINTQLYDYRTALSFVLDSVPLTRWLLEHGADPNLGPHPVIKLHRKMVQHSGSNLQIAACRDPAIAIDLINLLLKHGARLEDSLPLHKLAECRPYQSHHEGLYGGPSSVANTKSSVQEDLAVKARDMSNSSRSPVLQYLIDLGYDVNANDMSHYQAMSHGPPLHWAIRWEQRENVRFLLEKGADPWGKDRYGRNALEATELLSEKAKDDIGKIVKEFM